ncbi:MAG: SDR family NAD(P)-dependent oxidoreductase [Pseudomonadota bacterium]
MSSPVVVIGGYGAGLGSGLADVFSAAGYRVAALSRRGSEHGGALNLACDLTEPEAVRSAVDNVIEQLGPIDVFIHNVAAIHIGPFLETPPERFEAVWRASVLSAVRCAQAVLPGMLERGGGTLLFSGATAALKGGKNFAAFASAKFALRALAQSLAREYQPQGIHVAHVILDGLIGGTASVERFGANEDQVIKPHEAAKTYLALVGQDRSAWTQEIDLRPYVENF